MGKSSVFSAQVWKSEKLLKVRTERPAEGQQFTKDTVKFVIDDDDMDSDTVEKSDLSFAGFMRVVEVGQHFVTKDTDDFRQFRSVACREYTLPRDDPASQPKGWIRGNMRIGLVLEVTTSFQHFIVRN